MDGSIVVVGRQKSARSDNPDTTLSGGVRDNGTSGIPGNHTGDK
jgi:hypothetical protein